MRTISKRMAALPCSATTEKRLTDLGERVVLGPMWTGTVKRSFLALVLLVSGLTGRTVYATGTITNGSIIVLGFGGSSDRGLRTAVEAQLRRIGEPVRDTRLRARDHACREEACLIDLATTHKAGRILGGDVSGADESYLVKLWLWDVGQRAMSRERTVACAGCDDEQRRQAVALMAGQLVEESLPQGAVQAASLRIAPAEVVAPQVKSMTTPSGGVLGRDGGVLRRRYWTPGRSAAVGLLAGVVAAAFTAGGVLNGLYGTDAAIHVTGNTASGGPLKTPIYVSYGIGAGCAVGLIVALAVPSAMER